MADGNMEEESGLVAYPRAIVAFTLFAALFAMYVYTAAPEVTFHDSGELITAARTLGIPHPPGSPTWCMAAHLFTKLPLGSIAHRVHIMSGFFAALTCMLVYLFVARLGTLRRNGAGGTAPSSSISPATGWRHHIAGVMAALFLAQCPAFWEKAVQAELYTMNTFFMVLILCLLARWLAERPEETGQRRRLVIIAALFGLGMGNYQALAFIAPVVAVAVAVKHPRIFRDVRLLAGIVAAGAAALLVYLYLPARSAANPAIDWGNPETWQNFRNVFRREHWGGLAATQYTGEFLRRWFTDMNLAAELGLVGVVLALVGVVAALRLQKGVAFVLLACLLIGEPWMALIQSLTPTLNNSLYYVTYYGMGEFHIPSYVILAILGGIGAAGIAGLASERRPFDKMSPGAKHFTGSILALACVGLGFPSHAAKCNYRDYAQPHAYGARLLNQLPPDSWLFAPGDDPHFVLCYLKFCENTRPDVALMLPSREYMAGLNKRAEEKKDTSARDFVEIFNESPEKALEPRYHQAIPANAETVQVFYTIPSTFPAIDRNLYPTGLVFKVMAASDYSKEGQAKFWLQFLADPAFELRPDSKHDFREMMALVLEHHANWHYDRKEYDVARLLYEGCHRYSVPVRPWVLDRLIHVLYELGDHATAATRCQEAIQVDRRNKYAWSMLGRIYAARNEYENALKCFESIVSFDPADQDARDNVETLKRMKIIRLK